MSQFFTLPTKTGQGLLANAIAYGEPLTIAELAIGDGGGKLPTPDANVTRLVNEVRRGPINQTSVDDKNPNWTVVEQVLPADVGGWTIREVGLYDTDGNLIAYGNYPETYKPQLSEGSARTQTIRFVMEVTDTSAVTLRIDPSVVMASRKYVDDQLDAHAKSRNHPAADTKSGGMMRFATLVESKKGEEAKAAQTPAGGKAQLDEHRQEEVAHKAGQIALDSVLSVFGEAVKTVQGALAALGSAARLNVGTQSEIDLGAEGRVVTADKMKFGVAYRLSTNGYIALPKWLSGGILQWGVVGVSNPAAGQVVTLPIEFPNSFLVPFATYRQIIGGTINDRSTGAINVSRSQIGLTGSASNEMTFNWWAIGY
ncbi:phage tail protein [Kushneria phyllosphaerae]|uniref:Uncharacterized protein n=1 Tax=Kushneria phyllosphaerae TaxID=2100822 RepID=A0A2R8CQR2_9GAMM|nr:phage tail protein [Kushneria phyllosphaerae]SPJ35248.1 hypothetical protein KSP9073_03306 [Kushneria phyllosphaerae]